MGELAAEAAVAGGAAGAAGSRLAREIADLQALCARVRGQLAVARQQWVALSHAMGVLHSTHSEELMEALELAHVAYKNLRKWVEEGGFILGEMGTLRADFDRLCSRMVPAAGGGDPSVGKAVAA